MKILILIISLLKIHCLLLKKNIFNSEKLIKDSPPKYQQININTQCNVVDLSSSKMMYNGIFLLQGVVRSGYLSVNKGNSVISFIFYGKQGITDPLQLKNYPTIFWLNGGPGSSSQLGNLFQLGPYLIKYNDTQFIIDFDYNNQSWVKQYNVIFFDQPVGTGLSYADTNIQDVFVTNSTKVAIDFYNALSQLYSSSTGCFNLMGITPDKPFYIFGQDYGSKYASSIAKYLLENIQNGSKITGLKGIALGNGFISPMDTLYQMPTFAYQLGLLDKRERSIIQRQLINAYLSHEREHWHNLHRSFEQIVRLITYFGIQLNEMNYMLHRSPYKLYLIEDYFKTQQAKNLFKLNKELEFNSQTEQVFNGLFQDFMKSQRLNVQYLLSKKLPVLVYNGQNDLLVQNPGTIRWVQELRFNDKANFNELGFQPWKVDSKVVGSFKRYGALELKIINNAGHLVPKDQPSLSRILVKQFVQRTLKG